MRKMRESGAARNGTIAMNTALNMRRNCNCPIGARFSASSPPERYPSDKAIMMTAMTFVQTNVDEPKYGATKREAVISTPMMMSPTENARTCEYEMRIQFRTKTK